MGDVSFSTVMDRLARQLGAASEAALARALSLKGPDFHNRKRRGTVPWDRIVMLAAERKVSLDALIDNACGGVREPGAYQVTREVDCPAYRAAVEGVLAALERADLRLPPGQMRRLIMFAEGNPLSDEGLDQLLVVLSTPGPAPPGSPGAALRQSQQMNDLE